MSSFDKVVKLACKPKAAPPKAKYLDPIIAATWSEDGAVHDVCKALSPRFREPNAIVVFKALIVLHTMIRNGATDNVLSYLCASEVLRLKNVGAGNWEGYSAPQNLQNYAMYLDTRIHAYRDLKHDAIRVQAETNRDMRFNTPMDEEAQAVMRRTKVGKNVTAKPTPAPTRSKTMMGRKLRSMTVEKGLLRETKAVHKQIDALVECRFYLDDLEDELNTTALRMLVKDLLILFQAGNEGVINVLEHYFEMSYVDAKQALSLYRHFCEQTEKVVEFLGVARKLQNLLNVPIPNLKHAPVSLAGALQEYLDDPNFEQNRIEYRMNREAANGAPSDGSKGSKKNASAPPPVPALPANIAGPSVPANGATTNKPDNVVDFFNSIEDVQPTMFNPNSDSTRVSYFQQMGGVNPFQNMQMQQQNTGFGGMSNQGGFAGGGMGSNLGPSNPFGQQQPPSHLRPGALTAQATGHRPFTSFIPNETGQAPLQAQLTGLGAFNMQSQQTGYPQQQGGMLQAQMTGSNPFRASMMPDMTGQGMFGMGGMNGGMQPQHTTTPFGQQQQMGQQQMVPMATGGNFGGSPMQQQSQPFQPTPNAFAPNRTTSDVPARPSSVPLSSFGNTSTGGRVPSPPVAQPVKTHVTGTRNPFGPISTPAPPVPKAPTMMEIAMGYGQANNQQANGQNQQQNQQQQQQPQATGGAFSFGTSALNPGRTDMGSVASEFNKPFEQNPHTNNFSSPSLISSQNTSSTSTDSSANSLFSGPMSSQPTGISSQPTGFSSQPTGGSSGLRPQMTGGFSGMKAFKPSSSFGASLLESLPSIPGSGTSTPAVDGNPSSASAGNTYSFNNSNPGGSFNSQPTGGAGFNAGSTLGQGLRPQMTGGPNPFRASMASPTNGSFNPPGSAPGAFGNNSGTFPSFGAPNAQGGQNQNQQNVGGGSTSWI